MDIGVGHHFTEKEAIRRHSQTAETEKETTCILKSVNRNGLEMFNCEFRNLYHLTMVVLSH
jgi:hypothetical protein